MSASKEKAAKLGVKFQAVHMFYNREILFLYNRDNITICAKTNKLIDDEENHNIVVTTKTNIDSISAEFAYLTILLST